jgi:hypothetical protein
MYPPPPLSKEEFDRRVSAGAKTFREIDPDFCKWNDERSSICKIKILVLSAMVAAVMLSALFEMVYDVVKN